MLDAPGQGLAAPQIGVGLRVFTFHVHDSMSGHLVNPVLHFPDDEEQDGPEGCLSIPGLTFDCRRRANVVAHGQNMYGDPITVEGTAMLARCVQHETDHLDGVLFVDRLDAETRKAAMRAIRDAPWAVGANPDDQGARPHGTVRLAFAGTPEAAVPTLRALLARRGHEVVAVITRPPARAGRGRRTVASPVAELAAAAGVPVLTPAAPGRAGVPRPAERPGRRLLPRRRLRRAVAARSPRRPAPRLGQPALLAAAGLARRGPGAARAAARRRRHRRVDVPDRGGPRHRPGVRRRHRDDPARRHGRRPARAAGGQRRRPDGGDDGRHRRRQPRRRPAAGRRRLDRAARSPSTTRGRLDPAGPPRRPRWSAPARRRRAPGRRFAATGSSSARCACAAATTWRRASCGSSKDGVGSAPRPPTSSSAPCSRRASGRWPRADWARGARIAPGERLG